MQDIDTEIFGRVAVLMGGTSAERDVSLKSGQAVMTALQQAGVEAQGLDVGDDVLSMLQGEAYDRVFIVIHGRGGEDGRLQGALDLMGLPYTGSGVLGSALAMDKLRSKYAWLGAGLPTPLFKVVRGSWEEDEIQSLFKLPVMVKPNMEGSSIGISKVDEWAQLSEAIALAQKHDSEVLIEQFVTGGEYTATILGEDVLPLIQLKTNRTFYDYEAKYIANDTQYICPCGLSEDKESALKHIAYQAFNVLGCTGWGRIDFMLDEYGQPWLIEANTVPGMTDHSLVPMAAAQAGIDLQQLVVKILKTSLKTQDGVQS